MACLAAGSASAAARTPFVAHRIASHSRCFRLRRLLLAAAADSTGSTGGGGPPKQRQPGRREFILHSVQWAILGDLVGSQDGKTIVNSILGAYGLPQLKATAGYRYYDDLDVPYTFEYPRSWVQRKNQQREGIYISDYNTADKLSLEVFPEPQPGSGTNLVEAAVLKLINPASEIGGDARLELPPASRIKTEEREIAGKVYTYIAFPSETITRSGYQVRRKNMAVAAARKGSVYVLGCSARSDQFNAEKEATFQHIIDSFRLL